MCKGKAVSQQSVRRQRSVRAAGRPEFPLIPDGLVTRRGIASPPTYPECLRHFRWRCVLRRWRALDLEIKLERSIAKKTIASAIWSAVAEQLAGAWAANCFQTLPRRVGAISAGGSGTHCIDADNACSAAHALVAD